MSQQFAGRVEALGAALGPLLVQLPPSLTYDEAVAGTFFAELRSRFDGRVACEPRHATWFTEVADVTLSNHHVARVAADPAVAPLAGEPGGWRGLVYRRLHGSPKIYYSAYSPEEVGAIARTMRGGLAEPQDRWCIFDNTALGEATRNALELRERL